VDETRTELERSKEHLLQSEKLVMVGKLAAGMAHSIRNPLTSVKMRLFSLRRILDMTDTQKEDLDVISEEIRHLDSIVGNFLEFSRPPKLKKQRISPSDVVDMALELLRHRLDSYEAEVLLNRRRPLPDVSIDAEQLKEVLVNLLINACEATGGPVRLDISEEQAAIKPWGDVILIRVKDDGPGIPEDNLARVFEPFFSTKEEGTGLGLSIADRILKEHGGNLAVTSKEGEGTIFTITIPRGEE
jgi:signal transduction histidine kinase